MYYLNDELIGYAGISAFSRNVAEINGMVHPSFRRKGHGRASLAKVLNKLKGENISKVELDVEIKNALNLYKSCGFKEESIMNYYRMF